MCFSFLGEGGFNDGVVFFFVMFGFGLFGLYELGEGGWCWLVVDVLWLVIGGLVIGGFFGILIGKLVVYLWIWY